MPHMHEYIAWRGASPKLFYHPLSIRQLHHIVVAVLCMSGRITQAGIARWTDEQGGSYRTVQRFFHLQWRLKLRRNEPQISPFQGSLCLKTRLFIKVQKLDIDDGFLYTEDYVTLFWNGGSHEPDNRPDSIRRSATF